MQEKGITDCFTWCIRGELYHSSTPKEDFFLYVHSKSGFNISFFQSEIKSIFILLKLFKNNKITHIVYTNE